MGVAVEALLLAKGFLLKGLLLKGPLFLLERIFGARTSAGETCRFLTDIYQTEIDCLSRNGIERDSFANFA